MSIYTYHLHKSFSNILGISFEEIESLSDQNLYYNEPKKFEKIEGPYVKYIKLMSESERKEMTRKANKAKRGMKESDYSRSVKSLSQKQRFDSMSKEQRHQHGMRSREGISEDGRISQTKNMLKAFSPVRQKGYKHALTTCPHCNKVGGVNTMKKYHFDKCKGKVS
jgi:hypothetical protein